MPFDGPRGDVDALGDLRIVETGLKIAKQLDLAEGLRSYGGLLFIRRHRRTLGEA